MLQQGAAALGQRSPLFYLRCLAAQSVGAAERDPRCEEGGAAVEGGVDGVGADNVAGQRVGAAQSSGSQPQGAGAVAGGVARGGSGGVEQQRGSAAQAGAGVRQAGGAVAAEVDGVGVQVVAGQCN